MNCLASHEKETLWDHCSIPTFVTTTFIFYFESRKNWLFISLTIVLYTLRHIALLWIQMIVIVLFFSLSFYLRNIYPKTYQLCLRLKYQKRVIHFSVEIFFQISLIKSLCAVSLIRPYIGIGCIGFLKMLDYCQGTCRTTK